MAYSIDPNKCTKCGMCALTCPAGLFELQERSMVFVEDAESRCLLCGHCMAACPVDAVAIDGLANSIFPKLSDSQATLGQLQGLMDGRRSIRHFAERPVEEDKLKRLLDAVSTVPTGGGGEPPPVTVVNGREKLAPLVAPMMEFYRGFVKGMSQPIMKPIFRLMLGRNRYKSMVEFMPVLRSMIEYYDETGEDCMMWGAPAMLLFHTRMDTVGADYDPIIECTYAMLAAQAEGLGTTMIGMVPPFINKTKSVKRRLGIPSENEVRISLIVGYPGCNFSRGIRRGLDANWV